MNIVRSLRAGIRPAALAVALMGGPSLAHAADLLVGMATALDGDTLSLDGTSVRLIGIDAPELDQICSEGFQASQREYRCGLEAVALLTSLVSDFHVACGPYGKREDGVLVGTCYAGGRDVAEVMVREGWAIADPKGSARYINAANRAREQAWGVWSGRFDEPAQWRAKTGAPDE